MPRSTGLQTKNRRRPIINLSRTLRTSEPLEHSVRRARSRRLLTAPGSARFVTRRRRERPFVCRSALGHVQTELEIESRPAGRSRTLISEAVGDGRMSETLSKRTPGGLVDRWTMLDDIASRGANFIDTTMS